MINKEIYEEMKKRGISRLCHFTKSKNFAHIINDFNELLPQINCQKDIRILMI